MKIAIITGATSGMGKEFVRKVIQNADLYDEIWIIARRKERLKQWAKHYPQCHFRPISLDLSCQESYDILGEMLQRSRPEVDTLIHCAGLGIYGNIEEISLEDQREMIQLNCLCVAEITNVVFPYLSESARMIYMASAAAFLPQPGFSIYAATKSFVLSYVRSLRAENKRTSRKITAVCPGAVNTEFFDRATAHHELPSYKKLVMADPKKVVNLAWKDNGKNKELSIYGPVMKAFCVLTKIVPHKVFLHFL